MRRLVSRLLPRASPVASRGAAVRYKSRGCTTTASPPAAKAPIAPPPPPKSDWYYIGWGSLAAAVAGIPLLVVAELQDSPDFRGWADDNAPAAMQVLRAIVNIPYNEPIAFRESEQPKGDDFIDVAVVTQSSDVAALRVRARDTPSTVSRALGLPICTFIFPDTAIDAEEAAQQASSSFSSVNVRGFPEVVESATLRPLRSPYGLWSVVTRGELEDESFELQDDATAQCAHIAELTDAVAASRSSPLSVPPRPLRIAADEEMLELTLARRREVWERIEQTESRKGFHLVWSPASNVETAAESSAASWSSWWRWFSWSQSGREANRDEAESLRALSDPEHIPDDDCEADLLLGDFCSATAKLTASHAVDEPRIYFEGSERASVRRRLRMLALNTWIKTDGDAVLNEAYRAAGIDRFAKPVAAPPTLESLTGISLWGTNSPPATPEPVAATPEPVAEAVSVPTADSREGTIGATSSDDSTTPVKST